MLVEIKPKCARINYIICTFVKNYVIKKQKILLAVIRIVIAMLLLNE